MSTPRLQTFDCTTRMFISCMCVTDDDLRRLGLMPEGTHVCCVSAGCQSRSVLHRLLGEEEELARDVTDMLDLRHADAVAFVGVSEASDVAHLNRQLAREATGQELVGWAWALLRDGRDEIVRLGRHLMGECYVRGIRRLAEPTGEPAHGAVSSRDARPRT